MRNLVIALFLTVAVSAPAPADERPLGAQEFTSVDDLAAAIAHTSPGYRAR